MEIVAVEGIAVVEDEVEAVAVGDNNLYRDHLLQWILSNQWIFYVGLAVRRVISLQRVQRSLPTLSILQSLSVTLTLPLMNRYILLLSRTPTHLINTSIQNSLEISRL